MNTTPRLATRSEINSTANIVAELARWLRTQKAAIMRQLPEQFAAQSWWERTHTDPAESETTVPAWVNDYYGVDCLHDTAREAVRRMLTKRSDALRAAPLYLVADPDVRAAVMTLTNTRTYRELATTLNFGISTATVVFSNPIPFNHPAPEHHVDDFLPHDAPVEQATPELKAVTWFSADNTVRCLDWLTTKLDATGSELIDKQIADSLRGLPGAGLPTMMYNGEWWRRHDRLATVDECRDRLALAVREVAAGATPRWDGAPVDDVNATLATTLCTVLGDAIAAGQFHTSVRRVSGAARHAPQRVHVLVPPTTGSAAQ